MFEITRLSARSCSLLGQRGSIFGQAVLDAAQEDEQFILLTADLATLSGMSKYLETYPSQFYNIGIELAKGDILNGSITAKYTLYNGNPEMTTPVADNNLSISKGHAEPQPQKITIADAKNYLCDLVEISNVSLIPDPESSAKGTRAETTKYYIVDDSDNQLQIYNGFHDSAYDDLNEFLDQTDKTIIKGIIISTKTDPELYIVEIVSPAGVNGITADTKANGPIYNVAGQRVNKAVKGVYIQNGKKFVVK